MVKLIEKYAPEYCDVGEKHIAKSGADTVIVRIDVAHMTGKAKT